MRLLIADACVSAVHGALKKNMPAPSYHPDVNALVIPLYGSEHCT